MTAVFTDAALAQLGDLAAQLVLREACSILHATRTPDASGGFTTVWAERATVACAVLDAGAPTDQLTATQEIGTLAKLVMLPRGTVVTSDERIRVGSLTYEVIDSFDPTSYEVLRRVLVRRVTTGLPA